LNELRLRKKKLILKHNFKKRNKNKRSWIVISKKKLRRNALKRRLRMLGKRKFLRSKKLKDWL
jgi:hypothetical protein